MVQGHKDVTVMRRLWVRSPLGGMNDYLLFFSFISLWHQGNSQALISVIQNDKFGGKWVKEGLTTMLSLSTLLCAGYSVKLRFLFSRIIFRKRNYI